MRGTVFSAGNEGALVVSLTVVVSGRCGGFVFAVVGAGRRGDEEKKFEIIITITNATFGDGGKVQVLCQWRQFEE